MLIVMLLSWGDVFLIGCAVGMWVQRRDDA
jgi:hypothetical protein